MTVSHSHWVVKVGEPPFIPEPGTSPARRLARLRRWRQVGEHVRAPRRLWITSEQPGASHVRARRGTRGLVMPGKCDGTRFDPARSRDGGKGQICCGL